MNEEIGRNENEAVLVYNNVNFNGGAEENHKNLRIAVSWLKLKTVEYKTEMLTTTS
jgi:hypothetical protein